MTLEQVQPEQEEDFGLNSPSNKKVFRSEFFHVPSTDDNPISSHAVPVQQGIKEDTPSKEASTYWTPGSRATLPIDKKTHLQGRSTGDLSTSSASNASRTSLPSSGKYTKMKNTN